MTRRRGTRSGPAVGLAALLLALVADGAPGEKDKSTGNVVSVTELTLDAPIAVAGTDVRITVLVRNRTARTLANVEWAFALPDGVDRSGIIPTLGPSGYAKIEQVFLSGATGEKTIAFTVDGQHALEPSAPPRVDNAAEASLIVLAPTTGDWLKWARKIAAKVPDLVAPLKEQTCVEGSVAGRRLTIAKLDPGTVDASPLAKTLMDEGLPHTVSRAVAAVVARTYGAWATAFQGEHADAFPRFASAPAPSTMPTESAPLPLGALGGSGASKDAISVASVERDLRKEIGGRIIEPGAEEAIKRLAASISAQLATWISVQPLVVKAVGHVSGAPGTMGPVTSATIERPTPCRHLK